MNFLAHLYLSADDNKLMIGSFIADFVKGKQIETFEPDIIKGIKLHRAIDEYTDNHEIVKISKLRIQQKYKKFSPVIIDMVYDHYLAKNWNNYSTTGLNVFANKVYKTLILNYTILPAQVKRLIVFMVLNNWLVSYSDLVQLQRRFEGMARRTKFDSGMENVVADIVSEYSKYESEFEIFFPELINFSKNFLLKYNL